MCDPISLTIAAAAVTAGGQIASGIGQAQQARYSATIADRNATLAADQGKRVEENTALEAQRRYRQSAQVLGGQQAAMAANGVDLNFGSAVDVSRDARMIAAEDVGQIYRQGSDQVKGLDIQGWNYRGEANAQRAKASGAIVNSVFSAASTALGGASQASKLKAGM
ncbi:hypothetical protein UFOVP5_5 [uncultured Caudovirales phage]|uniref:Uncharacterized protein n=1 Tax=uncultured Caudovirales phage TaxID=2100421 RepID=A0A6J5KFQ2_9CAUD|nr:hypothetical protein UFOVP5_5 [uncultured Caudovirales phage]